MRKIKSNINYLLQKSQPHTYIADKRGWGTLSEPVWPSGKALGW